MPRKSSSIVVGDGVMRPEYWRWRQSELATIERKMEMGQSELATREREREREMENGLYFLGLEY